MTKSIYSGNLPILQKLVLIYKSWNEYRKHFPKDLRYTLGLKIDSLFLDLVELIITASYSNKQEKLPYIMKASLKLDILKFFLQISWENKALDNNKYINISEQLSEIGRILGGWKKQVMNEK